MRYLTNITELAKEIQRREHLKSHDISLEGVKCVIGHISDIISEEWRQAATVKLTTRLRYAGLQHFRTKYKKQKKQQSR